VPPHLFPFAIVSTSVILSEVEEPPVFCIRCHLYPFIVISQRSGEIRFSTSTASHRNQAQKTGCPIHRAFAMGGI
jgi:hypothetical protein